MKKVFLMCLVVLVSIEAIACSDQKASTETAATNIENAANSKIDSKDINQNQLVSKIEAFYQNDCIKKSLNSKKINEYMVEYLNDISNESKEELKNLNISLETNNFNTEESTYQWIAKYFIMSMKNVIENESVTQSSYDQTKQSSSYLEAYGVKAPDLKINKGMSDAEIENICVSLMDYANGLCSSKVMGLFNNNMDMVEGVLMFYYIPTFYYHEGVY